MIKSLGFHFCLSATNMDSVMPACSLPLPQVCAMILSWCKLYKEIKGDAPVYSSIICHTQVSLSPIGLLLKEALLSRAYLSYHSSAPRISSPLSLCLQQLEPLEKWHLESITALVGWRRKEEAAVPHDRPIQISHCSLSVHSLLWPHLPPLHSVSSQHQDQWKNQRPIQERVLLPTAGIWSCL